MDRKERYSPFGQGEGDIKGGGRGSKMSKGERREDTMLFVWVV